MKITIWALRPTTRTTLAMTALLLLGAALAFAQKGTSAKPNHDKWGYGALQKVPQRARNKRNPLESDPTAVAAGGKLFEQHCAECHGMKAEGGTKGPSLLRDEVQRAAPGALFWILTNGVVRRSMPVWSKLPELERWQIVAFLRSLGASANRLSSAPR
jgi:mono/diheme cytochrome c family protein